MKPSILVCGGAGYIGSHMVRLLISKGLDVVVFDNLSTGHAASIKGVKLVQGDVRDSGSLDSVFEAFKFEAVMHFCASSLAGESVTKPLEYFQNNVGGSISLLQTMQRHDVDKIIFSSSAAIFGEPVSERIDEQHPKRPVNPYGASKLMVERILADTVSAHGLRAVSLRYFNAAGASLDGGIGESHDPETHLIPNALSSANGRGHRLKIFGADYPTHDGSCIRDYIHVDDLARAHLSALYLLRSEPGFHEFNLGNGEGFSVFEVIRAVQRVTSHTVDFEIVERREGDPSVLVASCERAIQRLGWCPKITELDTIVESAWAWHKSRTY